MNTKDTAQMKKFIDALDIPTSRKEINVHTVRWLLRTKPKLDDKCKSLLSQWLRENDVE